jgi:uncharacterized protein
VKSGDMLGIYDGRIVAASSTANETLMHTFATAPTDGLEIVTIYFGSGASESEAQSAAAQIREAHPGLAVEVIAGGQPHYPYVVSLE